MHSPRDDESEPVSRLTLPWEPLAGGRATGGTPGQERLVGWLTEVGEVAGNVLVYSSAYLAAVAMLEVAIAMVLLSLPPSPAPVVVGLVTFAVYANDRIADADTDVVTTPEKAAFVTRHRDLLYGLSAVAYGLALTISVVGGPLAVGIALLPGMFWVLYASDWIPEVGVSVRRLKEVLVLNSVVVALAWATTLTFLPLAFGGQAPPGPVLFVFGYFLLRSFVDTEIPNVRDVEGDAAIGVATLPVVFGVGGTRLVLYAVDLLTAGLVLYAVWADLVPLAHAVALAIGLLYSTGIVSFVGRFEDVPALAIASELEYLVVGAALAPMVYGL